MLRSDWARIARTLVAISLSTVLPVSAVSAFPDYPVKQVTDYAVSTQTTGLRIGVEAVEDLKQQETYFHTELASTGFVPVFVVIQNASNDESLLFDKSKVTYGPAEASVSTPKTGSKVGQVLALSAIPFVGIFSALNVISNVSQIQQNLLKKELHSTTLSPGASVHGFLYIPVQKNAPREKVRLRFAVSRPGADETAVLDLVF